MLFRVKAQPRDMLRYEALFWDLGLDYVAGTDEVGRGCLAGPVVACAVILPKGVVLEGVHDSKALSPLKRAELAERIKATAISWAIGSVGPSKIDEINILQASLLAMRLAIDALDTRPQAVLVDGNQPLDTPILQKTVVKGDALSQSIAAASILAKVERDRVMAELHKEYPEYGFLRNKGYPTKEHREALLSLGPTPHHRLTFKPRLCTSNA